jgi:hypothetical protein
MSYRRLFTFLAVAAASLLLAAPMTDAAPPRPDDRGLARGAGVAMPDLIERAVDRQARTAPSGDLIDRAVSRLRAHDLPLADAAGSPARGFDWAAAGIGASTASVLLLLAVSGFAVARRFRFRSISAS